MGTEQPVALAFAIDLERSMSLTNLERRVAEMVCGFYDDPVGANVTLAEMREQVSPDVSVALVDGLVEKGYLEAQPLRVLETGERGPDAWIPTDKARALLPDRYEPPIGTATPFSDELAAYEAWKASGEHGPCPMCKAGFGEMHRRKYCFGMNMRPVGCS